MERKNAWEKYPEEKRGPLLEFSETYRQFISDCKTERECTEKFKQIAKRSGFTDLEEKIKSGGSLKPGDKVYAVNMGKGLAMYVVGTQPIEQGMNILGAHIDSPRLDLKQNPLYGIFLPLQLPFDCRLIQLLPLFRLFWKYNPCCPLTLHYHRQIE